jgi:uncharacterized protein (TIGR01777 family)
MKIAVTGSSGFIGSALVPALRADGHEVLRVVRRMPDADDEVRWDPQSADIDVAALEGVEGIVNLAGAGVGDKRWTEQYKWEIRGSRVRATDLIARTAARLDPKPQVLVSAAAIGFYGDTGDTAVDETAPRGQGFLAEVVEAWEHAADPAREAGIRVAHPRSGLVVAKNGGAWAQMLPFFKLGLGGKLGSGHQWWSFVTLEDEIRALKYLLTSDLTGPVNVTVPSPATNADVTAAMGRVFQRPTILPVPSLALKVYLGEFSTEVLGSKRVLPAVLNKAGFEFSHPDMDSAMKTLV